MARVRMCDAEREAKRKARSAHTFSDAAYRHYDTSNGFGSFEEWLRAADALTGNQVDNTRGEMQDDLDALFLDSMPSSLIELKKAFRNAMFVHHPDYGGTNDAARKALDAFGRLKSKFNN
jgi:hypothetical protein